MGDSPSCPVCGAIMTRNGSCYRCMSCGVPAGVVRKRFHHRDTEGTEKIRARLFGSKLTFWQTTLMLNADDPQTITSLLLLREVCLSDSKPLVFWIGAGASRWLDYPTWKETALAFRSDFFGLYRQSFDNARAITSLNAEDYPAVFQLCRDLDQARYYRILAESFGPRASTPLYLNFLTHLRRFRSLSVITTNIDEALESRIPECALVQRSDLGRINGLLREKKPFIGKLHGTVSAIGSVVFATDDYERLVADSSYIHALDTLFSTSTVIFLGYGLRDQYLIELLTKNYEDFSLFGAGPHFTVTTCPPRATSLRPIGYHISLHPDHRRH